MKISSYCALVLLGSSTSAFAQQVERTSASPIHGYVRFGVGYDFPVAGATGYSGSGTTAAGITTTSIKRASMGSGVVASVAGGAFFSRYVGAELGIQVLAAPTSYHETLSTTVASTKQAAEQTNRAQYPVYVIPALVLSTGGDALKGYSRLGVVLPVYDKMQVKTVNTSQLSSSQPVQTVEGEQTITNRFGAGMSYALGLTYPVAKGLRIWAEIGGISRSAYAQKAELTRFTTNGLDQLANMTTRAKQTQYEFELTTTSSTAAPNPAEPTKQLTFSTPYSTIGVHVGLQVGF